MWRTLIVDDEQHARASLTKLLQKAEVPFEIVGAAGDGFEGLDAIRELQPDVVISDIGMPGMDGVKLLKTARHEGCDCRFVMLTCMNEFEYAREALEYGASGYLLKLSMDVNGLKQTMEKVNRELEQREQLFPCDTRVGKGLRCRGMDSRKMGRHCGRARQPQAQEDPSLGDIREFVANACNRSLHERL